MTSGTEAPESPSAQAVQPPILVVDYGAGNMRSVRRALEAVGVVPEVSSDPARIAQTRGLILPGVGSAGDAMDALAARRLIGPLRAYAQSGRPFLGVCVGLQLLFERSEEGGAGGVRCLGILPGAVRRFRPTSGAGLKVPHMGWNTVRLRYQHPLISGIPDECHFYFVHSYYAEPADPSLVLGHTEYGTDFASIVAQDNIAAVQFHPEKSSTAGLRLYANFARQVRGESRSYSSR